jgi:hypothetical protein
VCPPKIQFTSTFWNFLMILLLSSVIKSRVSKIRLPEIKSHFTLTCSRFLKIV